MKPALMIHERAECNQRGSLHDARRVAFHRSTRRIMVLCRIVKGAQDGELDITEQVSCYEKAKYELMSAICSLAHPRYRSLDYLDH